IRRDREAAQYLFQTVLEVRRAGGVLALKVGDRLFDAFAGGGLEATAKVAREVGGIDRPDRDAVARLRRLDHFVKHQPGVLERVAHLAGGGVDDDRDVARPRRGFGESGLEL